MLTVRAYVLKKSSFAFNGPVSSLPYNPWVCGAAGATQSPHPGEPPSLATSGGCRQSSDSTSYRQEHNPVGDTIRPAGLFLALTLVLLPYKNQVRFYWYIWPLIKKYTTNESLKTCKILITGYSILEHMIYTSCRHGSFF
jgi:hypothetical protein